MAKAAALAAAVEVRRCWEGREEAGEVDGDEAVEDDVMPRPSVVDEGETRVVESGVGVRMSRARDGEGAKRLEGEGRGEEVDEATVAGLGVASWKGVDRRRLVGVRGGAADVLARLEGGGPPVEEEARAELRNSPPADGAEACSSASEYNAVRDLDEAIERGACSIAGSSSPSST